MTDDQIERLITACEGIAYALSAMAGAILQEDAAETVEPKRDPLRTMDDPPAIDYADLARRQSASAAAVGKEFDRAQPPTQTPPVQCQDGEAAQPPVG